MKDTILLNELKLNQEALVKELSCEGSLKRRLLDLGIIKNTKIKAILKSPFGDPTAYEVRGSILALRKEDANYIQVCTCI